MYIFNSTPIIGISGDGLVCSWEGVLLGPYFLVSWFELETTIHLLNHLGSLVVVIFVARV